MEMLCCSPRSASSLLERAGLFPRTDEEYELRVIVWEARAVATEPPKARRPQWTQRSAPPSSTRLRLRMHHPDASKPAQPRHAPDAPAPRRAGWEARGGPRAAAWQGTGQLRPAADRRLPVQHRRRHRVQLAHAVAHVGNGEGADAAYCGGQLIRGQRHARCTACTTLAPALTLPNPHPSSRPDPYPSFPSRGRAQLGGALRAGRKAAHGPIP